MRNFYVLACAIDYIEENLSNPLTQEDIAAHCYISLSALQKLFKYVFHFTIKEYISKRRLTRCAREIIETDNSITDIAFRYQYNSPEVFCRAFSKLWGVTPSGYAKQWKFSGIFPRIIYNSEDGGAFMNNGKKLDISELYDFLKEQEGTYVICFDIVGLMPINENIGRDAGDKAILTSLKRIDEYADENMLQFRIGGDEFALVTCLTDMEKAKAVAEKILSKNGEMIECGNKKIPLSMRGGMVKITGKCLKYNELFEKLHNTINRGCENDKICFVAD